jgi:hypothetical protein
VSIDLYNNVVFLCTGILDERPMIKNVHSQRVKNMADAHHASMSHVSAKLEFTMMNLNIVGRLVDCIELKLKQSC